MSMSMSTSARLIAASLTAMLVAACSAPPVLQLRMPFESTVQVDYSASMLGEISLGNELEAMIDDAGAETLAENTPLICIQCQLVSIPQDAARQVIEGPATGIVAGTVNSASVAAALAELMEKTNANVLTAPKVSVHLGERASISVINHTSYIKDFEVQVTGDVMIADPVVDVIKDGLLVEVVPRAADEHGVDLEVTVIRSDLKLPIPEVTVSVFGTARPVTLQTPIVRRQRLAARAVLDSDSTLVFGELKGDGDDVVIVFLSLVEMSVNND